MLITHSNSIDAGIRKRTISKDLQIGPLSIQFIIVIILAAIALLYLAQSTQSASKNYKLEQLREEKAKLQLETQRLDVESTRLKSLPEIQKSAEELNLVQN